MTNELTTWAELQNKALEVEAVWLRHIGTSVAWDHAHWRSFLPNIANAASVTP